MIFYSSTKAKPQEIAFNISEYRLILFRKEDNISNLTFDKYQKCDITLMNGSCLTIR
jgi:hypothetical protein